MAIDESDAVAAQDEGAELEADKMFTPDFGVFVQGLAGMGGDRPFTYGAALGLRINF